MTANDAQLLQTFPDIDWREPIDIVWPDTRLFACRLCIARFGLKRVSLWQWPLRDQAVRHILDRHPAAEEQPPPRR